MAVKTIDLVINTSRGEKNVKQLHQLARQVEKVFGNINKLKINIKTDPAKKAIEKLNAELTKGKGIVDNFMDTNKPNQFARKISTIKEEMGLVRKAFDDSVKATDRQRAATTLLAGNFKALRLEAAAFARASGADPSKTIGSVGARLKEIEKFPKTIMAGNQAMNMLKRMQELTVAGSKDFLLVSKAIGKQLEINANIQLQAKRAATPMPVDPFRITQKALPAAGETSGTFQIPSAASSQIKAIAKSTKERLKAEKKVTEEANKQLKRERDRKKEAHRRVRNIGKIRRGRMQEKMLGAGFPLLFGGGAGSVAGSLAGSMLAPPGMGFGAQILGSAVGTVLEQNLQKIQAIGNATKIINLDALKDSGIRVNAELEKTVNHLKLINEEQKAQELIMKEVARQTGTVEGTNEDIADLINLLGKEWGSFTALISSTLGMLSVPFIAALTGILSLVNLILKGVNYIISGIGWLLKKLVEFVLGETIVAGILRYVLKLDDAAQDLLKKMDDFHRDIEEQRMAIKERIALGEKEAAILEKIRKTATELGIDKNSKEYVDLDNAIRGIAALEQQEESVKRLRDLYKSLGQTIEDGVVNAIQAAIDGTKTLGDVARSVFRELQRSLIRYSVNALSRSIFSFNPMENALSNEITSDVTDSVTTSFGELPSGTFSNSGINQFEGVPNLPYLKADGGSVKGGNDYIVGERGPELFSPGVSGMITPNHMLGGSTNVVVNVDASGSSVEGDDQRSRELGQMLSAAIQSELIKQKRPGGLLR